MGLLEILLIGIGLAMDAFAVAICKGLSKQNLKIKDILLIATCFGSFQAIMPTIGYFLGIGFENIVLAIDHWITFGLLTFIGAGMIKEAFSNDEEENKDLSFKTIFILGLATSIDALAVRDHICILRC